MAGGWATATTDSTTCWVRWCSDAHTTTGAATAWQHWNLTCTASTATTGDDMIWLAWQNGKAALAAQHTRSWVNPGVHIGYAETPGERADRYRREEEARNVARLRAEQAQAKEREANAKAEALLRSLLRPEQIDIYERRGVIVEYVESEIVCPKTGQVLKGRREYELTKALHGNITRKEEGKAMERFCVYVPDVPVADHLAGQLLHLRMDEVELRRRANITQLH